MFPVVQHQILFRFLIPLCKRKFWLFWPLDSPEIPSNYQLYFLFYPPPPNLFRIPSLFLVFLFVHLLIIFPSIMRIIVFTLLRHFLVSKMNQSFRLISSNIGKGPFFCSLPNNLRMKLMKMLISSGTERTDENKYMM